MISCLLLASCGGDDEPSFAQDCTYLKVREGTKFTYSVNSSSSFSSSTIASEVTGQETIDGVVMSILTDSDGADYAYIGCNGDMLTQTLISGSSVGSTGMISGDAFFNYDFGTAIGDSSFLGSVDVSDVSNGISFTNSNDYYGKVLERDLTMEVAGTNYTDVIKYEVNTFSSGDSWPSGVNHSINTIYYFAPEVSAIYTVATQPYLGTFFEQETTVELIDYTY